MVTGTPGSLDVKVAEGGVEPDHLIPLVVCCTDHCPWMDKVSFRHPCLLRWTLQAVLDHPFHLFLWELPFTSSSRFCLHCSWPLRRQAKHTPAFRPKTLSSSVRSPFEPGVRPSVRPPTPRASARAQPAAARIRRVRFSNASTTCCPSCAVPAERRAVARWAAIPRAWRVRPVSRATGAEQHSTGRLKASVLGSF